MMMKFQITNVHNITSMTSKNLKIFADIFLEEIHKKEILLETK